MEFVSLKPDGTYTVPVIYYDVEFIGVREDGQKNYPGSHDQLDHGSWSQGRELPPGVTRPQRAEKLNAASGPDDPPAPNQWATGSWEKKRPMYKPEDDPVRYDRRTDLTTQEKFSLWTYQGFDGAMKSTSINDNLRGAKKPTNTLSNELVTKYGMELEGHENWWTLEEIVKNMESAIGKSTVDRDVTIFRGIPSELVKGLEVGDVIADKGFASATGNERWAASFGRDSTYDEEGDEVSTVMRIRAKPGDPILYCSLRESEYIIQRNAAFVVTGKEHKIVETGDISGNRQVMNKIYFYDVEYIGEKYE
jgi:hypothetical protein